MFVKVDGSLLTFARWATIQICTDKTRTITQNKMKVVAGMDGTTSDSVAVALTNSLDISQMV